MPQNGLLLRMFVLCVVTACAILIAACVSTPGPTRPFAPINPPKGLPLASSDTIAFLISSENMRSEADDNYRILVSPISHDASVAEGFRKGFLEVRPDATLMEADAALRAACFDNGEKSVAFRRVVLPIPDLIGARCRTLVEVQRIKYLVIIGGQHDTETTTQSGIDRSGGGAFWNYMHDFRMFVRAIDTSSGESKCESSFSQPAQSAAGVAWFLCLYCPPIPIVKILDESGYWTAAGIGAGQLTAWCFVTPSGQASSRNGAETAGDVQYDYDFGRVRRRDE